MLGALRFRYWEGEARRRAGLLRSVVEAQAGMHQAFRIESLKTDVRRFEDMERAAREEAEFWEGQVREMLALGHQVASTRRAELRIPADYSGEACASVDARGARAPEARTNLVTS